MMNNQIPKQTSVIEFVKSDRINKINTAAILYIYFIFFQYSGMYKPHKKLHIAIIPSKNSSERDFITESWLESQQFLQRTAYVDFISSFILLLLAFFLSKKFEKPLTRPPPERATQTVTMLFTFAFF